MSSSAINSQIWNAKAANVQNYDGSPIVASGAWTFKSSTNVTTFSVSDAGNATVAGFTALGTGNAAIKIKVLTGATAAAEGGVAAIAHGLTGDKIMGITCKVAYAANTGVLVGLANAVAAGYEYSVAHDGTNINVTNHPTYSENILSKPITIMVFYIA